MTGTDREPVGAHVVEVLRSRAQSLRDSAVTVHPLVASAYVRRARELESGAALVLEVIQPKRVEARASA
jgi:hypothetical protein